MASKPAFKQLLKRLRFREGITSISHEDIRSRLQTAIREYYEENKGDDEYGPWCYVQAVLGDDKSGDVVFYCHGELMRCGYTLRTNANKATAKVDIANAVAVTAITNYLPREAAIPATEAQPVDLGTFNLGELVSLKEGAVGQDGTAYLKLIAPGWGSSGYYSEKVLERDGPAIFKTGTKNFWNHQTAVEEAERPEGDLRDLASVLTEDAYYDKNGIAGAGLYARAKVFEQFRQPVDDLAKHIGVSIRACGVAKNGTAEGKSGPIIEKLTAGISVDYVTTPGAGGEVLQLFEAARTKIRESAGIPNEGGAMDAAEKEALQKLQESNKVLGDTNRKILQKLARSEARDIVREKLSVVTLPDGIKSRLLERICEAAPITVEGELDNAGLLTLIEKRIKEAGEDAAELTGGRIVVGMGAPAEPKLTEAEQRQRDDERMRESEAAASQYGFSKNMKTGRRIFAEGREAFDPEYNSADVKGVA